MENLRFKTPWNADEFPKEYKKNVGPSMTIPDQTMSIKEIMERYASGLPLEGQRVPIYNGEDDDLPDLTHMDLADRERIMDEVQEEVKEIKTRYNESRRRYQVSKKKDEITKEKEVSDEKPGSQEAKDGQ